jgi:spermidine dehydrogenase
MSKGPRAITRRDFIGGTLVGAGALLVRPRPQRPTTPAPADDWYGYGGVGEYASSHGNTPEVVQVAHDLRDGLYAGRLGEAQDTGELYDLVVVGGGFAGLGAAHEFLKERPKGSCLVLDNHPTFGGEAKQNEFVVDGYRLIGPQGSNAFILPQAGFGTGSGKASFREDTRSVLTSVFEEFRIPTDFQYASWDPTLKPLRFAFDNYSPMLWAEDETSVGHFFPAQGASGPRWVVDLFQGKLKEAPLPERVRADLDRWRASRDRPPVPSDVEPWLDSMSYRDFLEKVLKLGPEVTAYADPIVAGSLGLGSDATSAYACYHILMPGVSALAPPGAKYPTLLSFPGGNTGFARYLLRAVVPGALPGDGSFASVVDGRVNFAALDEPGARARVRVGASVIRVAHEGPARAAERVRVVYVRKGELQSVRAQAVVMATGSWITRHVVADMPEARQAAYEGFVHAPILVANVAVRQWRFLYDVGATACRWDGGFGFFCNLRRPMLVGGHQPPLHPDHPAVLTFYVPFQRPGKPAAEQGKEGRLELLTTAFADYEGQILRQLGDMFGGHGFRAERDVAGIILNRWGHAYVVPQPGFHFGRIGAKAPREIVREPFGRIFFGHSEMEGHQNFTGAILNGRRAAREAAAVV